MPSLLHRFRRTGRPSSPDVVEQAADAAPAQAAVQPFDMGARLRETLDLLEVDVARLIGDVLVTASAAHNDIAAVAAATLDVTSGSRALAASAEDAARDVGRLATASVELTASGEEITRRLRDVATLSADAKQTTGAARSSVDGLKTSSNEIGAIVGLISALARKTNLLALNATIEAARAGDAGKGFAVVASEVKSLASATQKATDDIAKRVDHLQSNSNRLIEAVERIGGLIEGLSPLVAAIAGAVETQTQMTADLSRSTDEASAFAARVGQRAEEIARTTATTATKAGSADRSVQRVRSDAERLQSRFVIFLRQTEMGSRRKHERLPCDLGVTLAEGSRVFPGKAVDLSEGGMLVSVEAGAAPSIHAAVKINIDGIGRCDALIVGRSTLGLHVKWQTPPADFIVALRAGLERIREDHADRVAFTIETAARVAKAMETAVSTRRLSMDMLFDVEYQLIEGTDPPQYRTSSLAVLQNILPAILDPPIHADPRIDCCTAVDRNAWLPVHNKEFSHPQRPGEHAWNVAHARNLRIFDDRAGLSAARNIRPSLIQNYNRDLGGGRFLLTKEIDAPIRVFGRHWGSLRVGYKR